MSLSVNEIPPLFVQLDQLEHCDLNDSTHWKEKARSLLKNINIFLKLKLV